MLLSILQDPQKCSLPTKAKSQVSVQRSFQRRRPDFSRGKKKKSTKGTVKLKLFLYLLKVKATPELTYRLKMLQFLTKNQASLSLIIFFIFLTNSCSTIF